MYFVIYPQMLFLRYPSNFRKCSEKPTPFTLVQIWNLSYSLSPSGDPVPTGFTLPVPTVFSLSPFSWLLAKKDFSKLLNYGVNIGVD